MATGQTPPLPSGYEDYTPVQPAAATSTPTQASPAAGLPPLPAGYENYAPVTTTAESAAPPAEGLGSKVAKAIAGPTTSLGTPLSPTQQTEESGVSDIFHGNIRQGAGKIWDAERPHVLPGSPIEKMIQEFNPNFRGAGAGVDNQALNKPVIDVAQFIDKNKNPVSKAIAEAAQSLTSPGNVAILASTGGLGLVESPTALATANRLLSAGFSAQAIGTAYQHLRGFKDAYDKGDSSEAMYQLTHAVLSGTISGIAAAHAAGAPLPLASEMDKRVAKGAVETAQPLTEAVKGAGQIVGNAAEAVGEKVKATQRATGLGGLAPAESLEKALRPYVGERYFKENVESILPRLVEENKISPVKTPEDMAEASHTAKTKLWDNEIAPVVAKHADEVVSGDEIAQQIKDNVNDSVRKHQPKVAARIDKWADTFKGDYPLAQASKAVTDFNQQLRGFYKLTPSDQFSVATAHPELGMLQDATDALRDKIGDKLATLGEPGWADLRRQYGALNQLQRVAEKRAVVYGRQAPINLPQTIGAVGAMASGHPLVAAIPLITKWLNSPEHLISGALKKAGKAEPAEVTPAAEPAPTGPTPRPTGGSAEIAAPINPKSSAEVAEVELPTHDDLSDAMAKKTNDPVFADRRAGELLAAARGEKGYSGTERRMANTLIDSYMGKVPAEINLHGDTLAEQSTEPNAPIPQIKSDAAEQAKNLGIEFRGIQEGMPGFHPGLAIFQDPESGTSVGVRLNKWSPEQLQKQLVAARERMGGKSAAELDWSEKAADTAKKTGGFTIDPRSGEVPKTGYMVEIHPEARKVLNHPATANDIKAFYEQHKDIFDANPQLHVGGYGPELNISALAESRPGAEQVAKNLDQISIWDNEKGEEIPTGGKNEKTDFSDYPLEQRIKDLDTELDIPENRLPVDISPQELRAHEAGHYIVGSLLGFKMLDGIQSHLHEQNISGRAAASTRFDPKSLEGAKVDENGNITMDMSEFVKNHLDNLLALKMSGGAAQELLHDTPIKGNVMLGADLRDARAMLKKSGFSPEDTETKIDEAANKAKKMLTDSKIQDIIGKYTQDREAGIDPRYQMTPEHSEKMLAEVREVLGAKSSDNGRAGEEGGDAGGTNGGVREGGGETQPGGKSTITGVSEARKVEEVKLPAAVKNSPHLTDEERGILSSKKRHLDSYTDMKKRIASPEELAETMKAGQANRFWYERAQQVVQSLVNTGAVPEADRGKFTALLAATSPQSDPALNSRFALSAFRTWIDAGRPSEISAIRRAVDPSLMMPSTHGPNAARALAGEELSGPKVGSFNINLTPESINPKSAKNVTNDMWGAITNGIVEPKDLSEPGAYIALSENYRKAAASLGWQPKQGQAASWGFVRTLGYVSGWKGSGNWKPPTEIVPMIDDPMVRKYSADIADIFLTDEDVRGKLKELGVDLDKFDENLKEGIKDLGRGGEGKAEGLNPKLLKRTAEKVNAAKQYARELAAKGKRPSGKMGELMEKAGSASLAGKTLEKAPF